MSARKNIADIYPLSPAQQGILVQALAEPGLGIHDEQLVCQIQGAVDRRAFEGAWKQVIERHAVLRTGFVWKNVPEPLQVVFKSADLPLEWGDWSALAAEEQAAWQRAYLDADRRRGFDLSQPPLLRLALFQLGPNRYQLICSTNHILVDGWCLPILIREFLAFYQARRAGRSLELPPARPYKDYIRWLKGRDLAQAEEFWTEQLRGLAGPTPVGVPAGPSEHSQAGRYDDLRAALQEESTSELRAFAQAHRLTLNTLVQGALALLLARYSSSRDVIFGTTVSGRPPELPGIENTVGLFINTLPVRVQAPPQASLIDWLEGLQAYNFELQQYEYTSGALVHQWSGLPGTSPLYESLLVFENFPVEVPDLGRAGLSIDLSTARTEGARTGFPLNILAVEGARLRFQLVHDLRRLSSADGARILAHLLKILEAVPRAQENTLDSFLSLIPEGEIPRFHALPARERQAAGSAYLAPRTATEARLAEIWAEVLGVERVGVTDNFFELGGHSLMAIQLYYRVREAYPVPLSLLSLFEEPNVARLAQAIEARLRGEVEQPVNLPAEAVLDPEIRASGPPYDPAVTPERVFLTGATGFLGAHLLGELLEQTRAQIVCLVRAPGPQEGLRRLQQALESHGLWRAEYANRLAPVSGDLARPQLGLPAPLFEELAGSVDAIYHNGAWVTYLFPYTALKPANVQGTQEILRLASCGRAKAVHYISSLAVFPLASGSQPLVIRETDEIGNGDGLFNGYAQSKWVAEKIVLEARQRGLPVAIYRPALVTGHSRTGASDLDNMLPLLIKGCLQIRCMPEIDTQVDMTPVDYASRAIVHLSCQPGSLGGIFHLANPRPAHWREIGDWLRELGFPIQPATYAEWQTRLAGPAGGKEHNALYPLLPLLAERIPEGQPRLANIRMPPYDCQATLAALRGSGIRCPPVDRSLLATYLDYFVSAGFLERPVETVPGD